jgi:hypothetical protein
MVVTVSLDLYFGLDGVRKGGCSLLPFGVEELRELDLPSGWCL